MPAALSTRAPEEGALALSEVYAAYAERVGRWAARLAGPTLDAEDLVHEVFLTVQAQLPRFRGETKLTSWLYQITLNVVRDRRRKERRRWFRNLLFQQEAPPQSTSCTPYDSLAQREVTEKVYAVLDQMSDRSRTLLILFEIDGRSGEELAEILETRIDTIWVQLHRARAQFRARYVEKYGELDRGVPKEAR